MWIYAMSMVANAASFNCSKASTESEKLICRDTELSTLDETMAQAYHAKKGRLSSVLKKELTKEQRAWLKSWPIVCTQNDVLQVQCARDEYRKGLKVYNS